MRPSRTLAVFLLASLYGVQSSAGLALHHWFAGSHESCCQKHVDHSNEPTSHASDHCCCSFEANREGHSAVSLALSPLRSDHGRHDANHPCSLCQTLAQSQQRTPLLTFSAASAQVEPCVAFEDGLISVDSFFGFSSRAPPTLARTLVDVAFTSKRLTRVTH